MRARTYSSEGIVLARRNYGEADRILVVFSKDQGKLSLMAKGVRKPSSRKRGHIEVFSHLQFSAARGKSLDIIIEAEMIDAFSSIRKDLKKVSVAYFFVETVGRLTREDEKNQSVFNLLLYYLNRLKKSKSLKLLRDEFTVEILTLLGFWPRGKHMDNPDTVLEEVAERQFSSIRVGKLLQGDPLK